MIDIRLPNITATTDKGQLEQIRSYLYQFAEQLNWALANIDTKADSVVKQMEASSVKKDAVEQAHATFSEVKSLIIKSADIVNAYYEEINHRLEGMYVGESEFGTYKEETALTLKANSTNIDLLFGNTQSLQTNMDSINDAFKTDADGTTIIGSEAWCRIGVLGHEESGFPIYGMEIGQVNSQNGNQTMKKFAQYRSDGVHLYDQNGIEVATISDYTLKITNARVNSLVVTSVAKFGGYTISTENGLAFKWGGTA